MDFTTEEKHRAEWGDGTLHRETRWLAIFPVDFLSKPSGKIANHMIVEGLATLKQVAKSPDHNRMAAEVLQWP